MSFPDPPNATELLDKLRSLPSMGDVRDFVDEIYPGWIVNAAYAFCTDYPRLNINWLTVAKQLKVIPQQVLLVKQAKLREDQKFLQAICDLTTQAGFCIRDAGDYTLCSCGRAVPSRELYCVFMEKELGVPPQWSPRCSGCPETSNE